MNPNLIYPSFHYTVDTDFALVVGRKATASSVRDSIKYQPVVKTPPRRDHPISAETREETSARPLFKNLGS